MGTKDRSIWYPRRYQHFDGYNGHGLEYHGLAPLKLLRTRTGTKVDNWKSKISNGQNATSDMTATFQTVLDEKPLYATQTVKWSSSLTFVDAYDGNVLSYYTGFPAWQGFTSTAEARAKAKFYKAVRDAEVKLQGLVFLGELRQTLQMLRRPLSGLQDLISDYLRRAKTLKQGSGRGGARRYDQAISKLWLEYVFGWVPLMMDIDDARKAYSAMFDKERRIYISVGGKDFYRRRNVYTESTLFHPCATTRLISQDLIDQTEIYRYRGVVEAKATTTAQDRFALFGFHPKEFIPTAWELLPWSFLLDYFANIGDILEATVTDTSRVSWVSKSRVRQTDTWRDGYITKCTAGISVSGYVSRPGFVKYRERSVQRWASPGISLPELTFRLPSSDRKLLNIAALLNEIRHGLYPQNPSRRNWRT